MNEQYDEHIKSFREKQFELIESYKVHLPPQAVGFVLIDLAVSVILFCAPHESTAYKALFASLLSAIENHYGGLYCKDSV